MTTTALGTPFYMAPQLLKAHKYSSKCDIWSVGVIYYELLYGTQPWKGGSIHQLLSNIQNNGLYFDPSV
jgi:serine/threonine protein kinase